MHSDIRPIHWLAQHAPKLHAVWLLGRFDRPIGTWLLFLPCVFGLMLGAPQFADPHLYALVGWCGLGALFMRAAGCVVNDLWDVDLDKQVERTASRPLASGQISKAGAIAALCGFLAMGLVVWLQLNTAARWAALASLPLVALYPAMKRITWWPQAFLGLTFNFGVLVGYAAMQGTIHTQAVLLYGACVAWTLLYDTIYAHQDARDDAIVGIKSTARLFGKDTVRWLGFFLAVFFVLAALATGWWVPLLLPVAHGVWQIRTLDTNNPALCLRLFLSNRDFGFLVVLAIIVVRGIYG